MKTHYARWLVPAVLISFATTVWYAGSGQVTANSRSVAGTLLSADLPPDEDEDDDGDDDLDVVIEINDEMTVDSDEMDELAEVAEIEFTDDDVVVEAQENLEHKFVDESARERQLLEMTEKLAGRLREAKAKKDEGRTEKLRAELAKVVTEHFQWMESKREKQIESLEARLASLRSIMETRGQNADKIVERRIRSLLRESDELDWNPDEIGAKSRLEKADVQMEYQGRKDENAGLFRKLWQTQRDAAQQQEKMATDQATVARKFADLRAAEDRLSNMDRELGQRSQEYKQMEASKENFRRASGEDMERFRAQEIKTRTDLVEQLDRRAKVEQELKRAMEEIEQLRKAVEVREQELVRERKTNLGR